MSSPPPSIGPGAVRKEKKEESPFRDFITLGRKKKKEGDELDKEMKDKLDPFDNNTNIRDYIPDVNELEDGEERDVVLSKSKQTRDVQDLIKALIDWINEELVCDRIIVRSLEEDLFDGQILQKLIEKLESIRIEFPEVLQTETGQKQKLRIILEECNRILHTEETYGDNVIWTVEKIHGRDFIAIVHLLTAFVRHYRPPIKLPENVIIEVTVYKKVNGDLILFNSYNEQLTKEKEDTTAHYERDAFDTLHDHAPEKFEVVKKSLIVFVNKHMSKVNLPINSLEEDFHDGVVLVLLMGLLGGYFVPLHNFYLTPKTYEEKVFNVNLAYKLMIEIGLHPKPRAEDIVKKDLKSTLRVLFNLVNKFKST